MRYVALSAAVFGAAVVLAAGSHAPLADAQSFSNTRNVPAMLTAAQIGQLPLAHAASEPQAALAPGAITASVSAPQSAAQTASNAKDAAQPSPDPTVTVAAGDSLSKLAAQYQTTYLRLFDANPAVVNPDLIYPGESLTVPAAGEQLASRPLPVAVAAAAAPAEVPAPTAAAPVPAPTAPAAPLATPPAASEQSALSGAAIAAGSVWDKLAACESGGNWSINTGNGFYGGLQFTLSSWAAVGGSGLPNLASRDEQIMRAQLLQARQGWGAWPVCSVKAGLR